MSLEDEEQQYNLLPLHVCHSLPVQMHDGVVENREVRDRVVTQHNHFETLIQGRFRPRKSLQEVEINGSCQAYVLLSSFYRMINISMD